jgi:Tol biopolymer transport system component
MKSGSIHGLLALGMAWWPTISQAQAVLLGRLTSPGAGVQLNAGAQAASISPDGRYVAFASSSNNIGPPSNGSLNVYRYDLTTDEYVLAMQVLGIGSSYAPSISDQGLSLAFQSDANDLVVGNPSGFADVFYSEAFDAGQGDIAFNTYQVSTGLNGFVTNEASQYASISGNGRYVAFSPPHRT